MKEKVVTLEEAAATVRDGALLGLTTSSLDNPPMAFLREILRQGVKNLRVATLPGGGSTWTCCWARARWRNMKPATARSDLSARRRISSGRSGCAG